MAKKVLVVDDSNMIRKVSKLLLERLGFIVLEAESAQSGLKLYREHRPEGILVDWDMPGMGGIDFIERLQGLLFRENPKVIYCVTEYIDSTVNKALHAGADSFMMKPFDLDSLQKKFQHVGLTP